MAIDPKDVLLLGCAGIQNGLPDRADFSSHTSLLDYSTVVFDPLGVLDEYTQGLAQRTFQGRPSWGDDLSAQLIADTMRRFQELLDFLLAGGTLAFVVNRPDPIYVDTGNREYSGTGRNRKTTNLVDEFDLQKRLLAGFKDLVLHSRDGRRIARPAAAPYRRFFDACSGILCYRATLDIPEAMQATMFVRSAGGAPVAAELSTKGNGRLLLLPNSSIDEASLDWALATHTSWRMPMFPLLERSIREDDEDEDPEAGDGTSPPVDEDGVPRYVDDMIPYWYYQCILDLIDDLGSGSGDLDLPSWASEMVVHGERRVRSRLASADRKIEGLVATQQNLQRDLQDLERRKRLVTATGDALLAAVADFFRETLRLTVEVPMSNRTDLRLSGGPSPAVVEVKGRTKSAKEADSAQLEKWASEHLEENGIAAKAILVVNGWLQQPLSRRTEPVFPPQMLNYAERREQTLVSGSQLLVLDEMIRTRRMTVPQAVRLLFSAEGTIDGLEPSETHLFDH